jgi:hypothetical protein
MLTQGARFIAMLDQGETLWKIYEAIIEIESWWNIKQTTKVITN